MPTKEKTLAVLQVALPWVLAVCAFTCCLTGVLAADSADFGVFMTAGTDFRAQPDELYSWTHGTGKYPFLYPPFFAMAFLPFSLMPRPMAYAAWEATSVLVFFSGLACLSKVACGGDLRAANRWRAAAVLPVLPAVLLDVQDGQINLFLCGILATSVGLCVGRRSMVGGLLLGLAVHLKVLPVVLVGWLLLRRDWRGCLGFSVGLAGCGVAALAGLALLHGAEGAAAAVHLHVQYLQEVVSPAASDFSMRQALSDSELNWALSATLGSFAAGESWGLRLGGFLTAGLLYRLALAPIRHRKSPNDEACAAGLAFIAACLANPTCWLIHTVALSLAFGSAWWRGSGTQRHLLLAAVLGLEVAAYAPRMLALSPPHYELVASWTEVRGPVWAFYACCLALWIVWLRPGRLTGPGEAPITASAAVEEEGA
ncbi:MAG: DUF2029 domain-containing protein [Planctomycetes bacterium]|nr:DUF2029 domain-containing protein [Planctomycetota bacterium]